MKETNFKETDKYDKPLKIKREILIGERFTRLIVIEKVRRYSYLCECDCGKFITVTRSRLLNKNYQSCGCLKDSMKREDLTGKRFGRLEILCKSPKRIKKKLFWIGICDCGQMSEIDHSNLIYGHTNSCGCLAQELKSIRATTHGKSSSRIYYTYINMVSRCCDVNAQHYNRYGARGITVSDEWLNGNGILTGFQCFYRDMGEKPSDKEIFSLDRIDNNGNYEKDNCKWSSPTEQVRNRSNTTLLEYGGEIRPMAEWAELLGFEYQRLNNRINQLGWSVEKALTTPVKRNRLVEYEGQSMTAAQWCRKLNLKIPSDCLYKRIFRYEWSIERAIQTPLSPEDIIYLSYNGVTKSLSDWSDIWSISYCDLDRKIKQNWVVDRILDYYKINREEI